MRLPWQDRKGALAPLKAFTLACIVAIGVWIGWRFVTGTIGVKPVEAALHETGVWAIRLLLATLAVTPFRIISGDNRTIAIRRMLGVSALTFTLIHLFLYVVQQRYDLVVVALEIVKRFYLTIGFASLAMMLALGLTSTDNAIKRLGAPRWAQLHSLVYPLTVLAIFHAAIQAKIDISDEVIDFGVFFALMGVRLMRNRVPVTPWTLLVLAIAAGVAAIGFEFLWYRFATGLPADRIFAANFIWDAQPRPAAIAFTIALALPVLAFATRLGAFGVPRSRVRT